MENIFFDIGLIFIVASIFSYIAKLLNQPKIPFYVLAGFVVGPLGLVMAEKFGLTSVFLSQFNVDLSQFFINDPGIIKIFGEIGIAFLLFVVGLELNLGKLKDIGLVATIGGSLQILILFAVGSIASLALGFVRMEAVYLGIVLALSSTVVVVKLLSDNHELNTLHGRIVMGILLLQDIFAVIMLSVLSSLSTFSPALIILALFKAATILIVAYFLSKFIFPDIFGFAAKSPEVLLLISLAVFFFFSLLITAVGFSIAIGAFIAGVTLGNLPYNIGIVGRIRPLRDFFVTLFFVSLGMEFFLQPSLALIKPLLIFLVIIVLFKPVVIMAICSVFGYRRATSFMSAISLAQISEFSLIILSQGLILGHVSQDIFSLGVLLGIITMTTSSYFINYGSRVYTKISHVLKIFDFMRIRKEQLEYMPKEKKYHIVLVGLNRIGYSIINSLRKRKENLLVVDYNPEVIKGLMKHKHLCLYGDIADPETLDRINFKEVDLVISTVPKQIYNSLLIDYVKEKNHDVIVFVTSEDVDAALKLYDDGADYVILPHFLGGEYTSLLLEDVGKDISKLVVTKIKHIEDLKKRKKIGHEHPKSI